MDTAIGHQAPKVGVLSDENKHRVCIINDINKVFKALSGGKNISSTQFDELYDAQIKDLADCLQYYQGLMYQRRVSI